MTPWVLFVIFLLGPCEALIPLLMFPAATESWATLFLVTGTFGLATVATMLGLLGTTIGMIRAFNAMSHAGAPDATQLALGISEALVNTALGLTTAIVATVLYNYFTTQVDLFNNRVEETSYEILTFLDTNGES